MNKEKFLAIIFGAFLGLAVGFYILIDRQLFSKKTTVNIDKEVFTVSEKKLDEKDTINQENAEIVLVGIDKEKIISSLDTYPLKVKLPVDGFLVIVTPEDEKAMFAKKGETQVDLKLRAVENRVKILLYTFDSAFSVLKKEIIIYYFPENL